MRPGTTDSVDASPDASWRCREADGNRLYLRSAHERDRAFLSDVFISARAEEFARTGWSPERIAALLAQQFTVQDAYYRRHYPHGRFDVVMLDEQAVGRFYHDWLGHEARLIDVALLPRYRGAGIGRRLVGAFVAQAARKAMPAVLYVEMGNPVLVLYRRLGFETVGENGVYLQMRRPAMPFEDEHAMPGPGLTEGCMR
jgi:ribosomal protein S18 acetylase RimI-like enzyme